MGNTIKKVDMLGAKFEMNFGRTERHKTCYGGILTIVAILLVVASAYSFIARLFNEEEVEVSTSRYFDDKYPRIKLLDAYMYPIIVLKSKYDGYIEHAKVKKYASIYGVVKETKIKNLTKDSVEDNVVEFFPFCSMFPIQN